MADCQNSSRQMEKCWLNDFASAPRLQRHTQRSQKIIDDVSVSLYTRCATGALLLITFAREIVSMRAAIATLLLAGVVGMSLGAGGPRGEPVNPGKAEGPKIWSAISISRPVFDPDTFTIDRPKVHLGLVNDGTQTLETGLRDSVLVVNGQPRRGEAWDAALKAGLRGDTWEKLAPGEHAGVACQLEDVIKEPGVYRVSWRGKNFESPEVVFRRMPRASDNKPNRAAPQAAAPKPDSPKETQGKLWAVISIIPPVLVPDTSTKSPSGIGLYVGNDGTQAVDTGADDSVLVINGRPQRSWGWQMALKNGPSGPEWLQMPPRDFIGIIRPLSGIVSEPGIYRVSWKGKNFQSPEVVYRILPPKAK
jgi:hypothetical protein